MALKSIIILSENKNTFYYVESVKLINQYLKDNSNNLKGKEIILERIKNYIKEGDEKLSYKAEDKISEIRFKLFEKGQFKDTSNNSEIIFEFINSYNTNELRKMSGEKINEYITYCSLYIDEEGIKKIKSKLNEKMKLVGIEEKDILKNLNFYEDKKFN